MLGTSTFGPSKALSDTKPSSGTSHLFADPSRVDGKVIGVIFWGNGGDSGEARSRGVLGQPCECEGLLGGAPGHDQQLDGARKGFGDVVGADGVLKRVASDCKCLRSVLEEILISCGWFRVSEGLLSFFGGAFHLLGMLLVCQ